MLSELTFASVFHTIYMMNTLFRRNWECWASILLFSWSIYSANLFEKHRDRQCHKYLSEHVEKTAFFTDDDSHVQIMIS